MTKKITTNWVLVFATLIGFAFASEWATRLFFPQVLIHALTRHDPVIDKRTIPFGRTIMVQRDGGRYEIKLNSHGFRMDQEVSQLPSNKRILVYGGSALFASHLPLKMSVFGLLKVLITSEKQNLQLLNTAVPGHEIRQTRLLMQEQIQKYKPAALIYIFDAGPFSRSLIAGDRSEINRLNYDKRGKPKLSDRLNSDHSEPLNVFRAVIRWFHRHSHLITFLYRQLNQAIISSRLAIETEPTEVKLSELPEFAHESTDIQELLFLWELHFQRMVQMTKAAEIPLLVVWLPARLELLPSYQNSGLGSILHTQRQMLDRVAAEYKNFYFLDTFINLNQDATANNLFISNGFNDDRLSVTGSRWFAKKTAPAIKNFLESVLEGHL